MESLFGTVKSKWRVFVTTFFVFVILTVPGTKDLLGKFVPVKTARANNDKGAEDDDCDKRDKKRDNAATAHRAADDTEDTDGCSGVAWMVAGVGGTVAFIGTVLALDHDASEASVDVSTAPDPPVVIQGFSVMAREDSCSTGRLHSQPHHDHKQEAHSHYRRPNGH